MPTPRIAIIGAGIAGLTLATALHSHADVQVFEKSRGVGGRMASRRIDDLHFDHGAQFFTARSRAFREFLQRYLNSGVVQPWNPRVLTLATGEKPWRRDWFEPHYVGVPSMTALPKALADGLKLHLQWQVADMVRTTEGWHLHNADGRSEGPFDWVVATAPAPQICQWFPQEFSGRAALQQVHYSPCIALMLAFHDAPMLRWDAARLRDAAVDWVVRGASRPRPTPGHTLLLHSTPAWAQSNFDNDEASIALALQASLAEALDQPLPPPVLSRIHRWRYASATGTTETAFELDIEHRLAACGDWTVLSNADHGGARIESSFLSASALAQQLLPMLT